MSSRYKDILNKDLHVGAQDRVKRLVMEFAVMLILQGKANAARQRADVVLGSHIDEGLQQIYSNQRSSWRTSLAMVLGGSLFGAFVPGFVDAIAGPNVFLLIVYTILGFLGMFLVFLGLRSA